MTAKPTLFDASVYASCGLSNFADTTFSAKK